jgi:anti-sigma B factor antagonist
VAAVSDGRGEIVRRFSSRERQPADEEDGDMTEPRTTIGVRRVDDAVSILDIHGEITAFAENALTEACTQAIGPNTRAIALNFTDMDYMNSSGIGLLVTLLIRMNRQKRRLLAFGLSEHYRSIFDLTRLNEAIAIYPTEAEVLAPAHVA